MKKKITITTAVILVLFAVLLTFQITFTLVSMQYQTKVDALVKTQSDFSKLAQADALIRENFLGEIDDEEVEDGLISGYLESLNDPYSRYMTREEYQTYRQKSDNSGIGIGVRVTFDAKTNETIVYSVVESSPASLVGIQPGDIIYKIDDTYAEDIGYYETVKALSGMEGTEYRLTVQRVIAAQRFELVFSVVPQDIRVPTVHYEMLDDLIAYVQIFSIDDATPDEFVRAVNALITQGAKGFVFDVRNVSDGSLNAVGLMLDRILPEVVLYRYVNQKGESGSVMGDATVLNLPISVLINRSTSFAAELFAVSLRDWGKATIVGETSFGKGVAQSVLEMDDGSAMLLSDTNVFPPKSDSFDGVGIQPDIECELKAENLYLITHAQDNQLQESIPSLME